MASRCSKCRSTALVRDDDTGQQFCESCGLLQEFDGFESHFGGIAAPQGTFIRVGTVGTGTVCSYRDKKALEARILIDDVSLRLGLSAARSAQIRAMASEVTQGEFGAGRWFSIFVAACAYVVMRADSKPLLIAQVATVAGCDDHEFGRMVDRVVRFLDLRRLPEIDVAALFEQALENSPTLGSSSCSGRTDKMRRQGVFLVKCMVKWWLATGRRPAPIVAAAMAFVGEVNGVEGAGIESAARELRANLHTCKLRYRELSEALVKVAQKLPWGSNVTLKNIVKNAPLVIQYMEKKSELSLSCSRTLSQSLVDNHNHDLDEAVRNCLRNENEYGAAESENGESRYFSRWDQSGSVLDENEKPELLPECLSIVYEKFQAAAKPVEKIGRERREREMELDWSEVVRKKAVRVKDVGLESLPPSFVAGCDAYTKRKEKIKAAKLRIEKIARPGAPGKKRKAQEFGGDTIDWEDMIIESLLLRSVREDDILTGHYNALMDLYVL